MENLPIEAIREICRRHDVEELDIFGSVAAGNADPASDVDFLVTFRPGAEKPWMGHFQALQDDLAKLLGRPVDLVDRRAVEKTRNWIRRRSILSEAKMLYAA